MEFEWDEDKRMSNLAKHDVDFTDVIFVFDDPHRIENIDDRKNYREIRINTIGLLKNESLSIDRYIPKKITKMQEVLNSAVCILVI